MWFGTDRNGNPRIAYAFSGDRPMFAAKETGGWTREEIVGASPISPGDVNKVCLDIDSEGNPHIAYKEASSGHLVYGVRRENHWSFRTVPTKLGRLEPGTVTGYDFRLRFQRDTPELHDTPHFVYHDVSTGQLGYTRRMSDGSFKLTVAARANSSVVRTGHFRQSRSLRHLDRSTSRSPKNLSRRSVEPDAYQSLDQPDHRPFEGRMGEAEPLEEGTFNVVRPTSITSEPRAYCIAYADSTHRTLNALYVEAHVPQVIRQQVAATVGPVAPIGRPESGGSEAYGDDNKLKLASLDRLNQWVVEIIDPEGGIQPCLAYEKISLKGHLAYATQDALKYASWTERT